MLTSPPELGLDCPSHYYSMLLKSSKEHTTEQTQLLEAIFARLEEERLKIDAFKRELPICMQLLTNAMEALRQELEPQMKNLEEKNLVLEQIIPLKNTTSSSKEEVTKDNADKANWMASAQLWNHDIIETDHTNLALNSKQGIISSTNPELGLASTCHQEQQKEKNNNTNNSILLMETNSSRDDCEVKKRNVQSERKARRRCWSPDLHRRFVHALHMLGGSQVATPKQIREVMKVDGLTNDEVKSHLQKYRLHSRALSPSPQATVIGGPQLVVLGGIWVPQEYATAHGGQPAAALYGAHAAATRKDPACI